MKWVPRCAVTIFIVLSSTPALAQSFMPLPNQLSVGMGVVGIDNLCMRPPWCFRSPTLTAATRSGPRGSASCSRANQTE